MIEFEKLNGYSRLADIMRNSLTIIGGLCLSAQKGRTPQEVALSNILHRCDEAEQALDKIMEARAARSGAGCVVRLPDPGTPWPRFSDSELICRCGCGLGARDMSRSFMCKLVSLRQDSGIPMPVTSAARCPDHNEAVSDSGRDGPHTPDAEGTCHAVDVNVWGRRAYHLMYLAPRYGFTGIGLRQHGPRNKRIVHLDDLEGDATTLRPWVWTY